MCFGVLYLMGDYKMKTPRKIRVSRKEIEKLTKEFLYEEIFIKKKTLITISKETDISLAAVSRRSRKYFSKVKPDSIFYVGVKIKGIELISKIKDEKGRIIWDCKCECGRIRKIHQSNLITTQDLTRGCGCKTSSDHHRWKGCNDISGKYFYRTKRGAESRELEFSITIEDMWVKFIEQNKKCALSGLEISLCGSVRNKDYKDLHNASIDRIDSSKGYTKDNIQWLHKDVNKIKQDFNEKDFIDYCRKIVDWHDLKETK